MEGQVFIGRRQMKARKDYVCSVCYGIIRKNTQYIRMADYKNGRFISEKRHIHCDAVTNAAPDNYAKEKVCSLCALNGRCRLLPSQCEKVIELVVPPAIVNACTESLKEARYEDETQ